MFEYMSEHSLYHMIRKNTDCNNNDIWKKQDKMIVLINPIKSMVSFLWDKANSADPDQTPQNVASDQGLHRLLSACSI